MQKEQTISLCESVKGEVECFRPVDRRAGIPLRGNRTIGDNTQSIIKQNSRLSELCDSCHKDENAENV